jgi:hypothetical protein
LISFLAAVWRISLVISRETNCSLLYRSTIS